MAKAEPFVISGQAVAPGETREVQLRYGESYLGAPVNLPISVIRAEEEGPRVFLTGVLHGDELNGMGIVRALLYDRRPELLRGTLVLVPVVNIYGLERHTRYTPDRRDPNRCFPGSSAGSMTSRLVQAVYSEIVRQCNYGIDFHTAAIRRTNYPNVRARMRHPETRKIAEAFGTELIVDSAGPQGSLRRTAVESGVPTIILEAGEVWKIEPGVVEIGVRGAYNVLRALGMMEGHVLRPTFQVTIKRTTWVRSESGGLLAFHTGPGDVVREGDTLATVYSLFGREQHPVKCPANGIILGMATMPVVRPGGPLYHLAVLPRRTLKEAEAKMARRSTRNPYARFQEDLATNVTVHDYSEWKQYDEEQPEAPAEPEPPAE